MLVGSVIILRHDALARSKNGTVQGWGRPGTRQVIKRWLTCSNKPSRSSTSFFNLISQRMRPQTGRGLSQGSLSWVHLPNTCCSRQGGTWLHAHRLIFYLGLACKSSRATPHCNTRSHRLHGLTSLARYKHTENGEQLSPAPSLALTSQVSIPEVFIFFRSLKDAPVSEL